MAYLSNERNSVLGSIVGLAVGDALGAPNEFKPSVDADDYIYDMVGGGAHGMPAGGTTDDTALAMLLAESLIANGGKFDAVLAAEYMVRWLEGEWSPKGNCFDIGATTRMAFSYFLRNGVPVGETDEYSSGNGGIMRNAPVAVLHWQNIGKAELVSVRQSAITHASPDCLMSAAKIGKVVASLIAADVGDRKKCLFELLPVRELGGVDVHDVFRTGGYVLDTMKIASWGLANFSTFEDGLVAIINLGGDSDTNGAVYGQIAGALYGLNAIPKRWRDALWRYNDILAVAEELWKISLGLH